MTHSSCLFMVMWLWTYGKGPLRGKPLLPLHGLLLLLYAPSNRQDSTNQCPLLYHSWSTSWNKKLHNEGLIQWPISHEWMLCHGATSRSLKYSDVNTTIKKNVLITSLNVLKSNTQSVKTTCISCKGFLCVFLQQSGQCIPWHTAT